MASGCEAGQRVVARVRELAASYGPPGFKEVPGPDAALFLCAIDHRSRYERAHLVDGRGPFSGSALLWQLGLRAERHRPGLSPPVLDNLLWELGRDDTDLLGDDAGDLREPDRDRGSRWY